MRILSLIYEYPPLGGGGGVVAAGLNEALARTGDEVTVVTSAMPGLPEHQHMAGVTVWRSWCRRRHRHYTTTFEMLSGLWPAYRRAARVIETTHPDVIHTHFIFPSGIVALALSQRYRVPYVLTAHGSDVPHYNPDRFGTTHQLTKPLWNQVVQRSAALTTASGCLAALIARSTSVRPHVIPNGFEPIELLPRRSKRPMILVVARLFPRKGVQYFIDAIQALPNAAQWEFVVAGDGPHMDVLQQQARAGRTPVSFVGFQSKSALETLYAEAAIFVCPSVRENFPMVLLEAMAAGCAVITTDADGCAEVVGDGAVIVPRADAMALRLSIAALMVDPDRRQQFADRARRRAETYRLGAIAARYRSVFEDVRAHECSPVDRFA